MEWFRNADAPQALRQLRELSPGPRLYIIQAFRSRWNVVLANGTAFLEAPSSNEGSSGLTHQLDRMNLRGSSLSAEDVRKQYVGRLFNAVLPPPVGGGSLSGAVTANYPGAA